MLRDTGTPVVLTQADLRERVVVSASSRTVVVLAVDSLAEELAQSPKTAVPYRSSPGHAAYVIYTSGSSGRPKGVPVSHRALCNHQHWALECMALTAADRMLQITTIGFDASVLELFTPLLAGAMLDDGTAGRAARHARARKHACGSTPSRTW